MAGSSMTAMSSMPASCHRQEKLSSQESSSAAGSFIYIPAGLRHGFRVGSVPSRKLNLYAPAGMVGYFDELSASITAGESDPARLDEIALRYDMEVTGPVPEGYL